MQWVTGLKVGDGRLAASSGIEDVEVVTVDEFGCSCSFSQD